MTPEADFSHLRESDAPAAHAVANRWRNSLLIASLVVAATPFVISAALGGGRWSVSDYFMTAGFALVMGNMPLYFLSSWGSTKLLDSWPDIAETRTWNDFVVTRSALNGAAVTLLLLSLGGYSLLAWEALSKAFSGDEVYWLAGMVAMEAIVGPLAYFVGYCFGQGWTVGQPPP